MHLAVSDDVVLMGIEVRARGAVQIEGLIEVSAGGGVARVGVVHSQRWGVVQPEAPAVIITSNLSASLKRSVLAGSNPELD